MPVRGCLFVSFFIDSLMFFIFHISPNVKQKKERQQNLKIQKHFHIFIFYTICASLTIFLEHLFVVVCRSSALSLLSLVC